MAQDEIQLLFKSVGLKAGIQELKILRTALKSTGNSLNFDKFNKSIKSIATNLKITQKQVTEVLGRFRLAIDSLPKEAKIRFIADLKSIIKIPREVKSILKTEPITLPFKLDASNLRNTIKEIGIQIRKIEDPISRVRTAFKTIETLQKQIVKIQNNQNISAKQRNALVGEYKKLLASVPTLLGVGTKQNIDALGKTKTGLGQLQSLEALRTGASAQAAAFQKVNQEQIETKKSADKLDKTNQKLGQNIGVAIGKLIRYRVAFFAMRGAIRATKASMEEFINLQFKLAELEIVIDRQTDSIEKYRKSAFKLSKDFGVVIGDIVSTMKVWAQTGLEQNKVLEATIATLVGVNALSSTTSQVVEALTAAIFTYGVAVEDNIIVLSKWLAVQRKFPITAQDLANSLKVVGAAAQVVGVDLDDLAGFVAAIGSATRKSGAAVGQSLKTIFARLPRKQVIQAFEGINIAVLKTSTQLRDLDNILSDLDKIWETLSTVQKANISTTLGGIRRYADFIALMDNYDIKLKAVIESQKAATEAFDANDIILGTVQKSWSQAQAAVAEFSIAVGQALLGPLSVGIDILKSFSSAIRTIGSAVPRGTAAFIAFLATFAGLAIAIVGLGFLFSKLVLGFRKVSAAAIGVTFAYDSLSFKTIITNLKTQGFLITVRTLTVSLGLLNVVMGVLTLLLSVGAAAWAFFSDGASEASDAVASLTVGLEQAFNTTLSQIKGIASEQGLLKDFADDIKVLGDEFVLLGQNEDKIGQKKAFDKLIAKFELLPRTFKPVNKAIKIFNDLLEVGTSNIDAISSALDKYDDKLVKTKKDLEDLSKRQLKVLIASKQRDIDLLGLDKLVIEDVVRAIQKVDKVSQDFRIRISKPINLPVPFGSGLADVLSAGIEFPSTAIANDIEVFFNNLTGQFKDGATKSKNEIDDIFEDRKLTEDFLSTFKINESQFNQSLLVYDKIFARVKESFTEGKGTLDEVFAEKPSRRQDFFAELEGELLTAAKITDAVIAVLSRLEAGKVDLTFSSLKATQDLKVLGQVAKEVDGDFRIGRELSSDAARIGKSIKGIIDEFDNLQKRFDNLQKTSPFGEVLNFEDFKLEQQIKLVNELSQIILETDIRTKNLRGEQKQLSTLFEFKTLENGTLQITKATKNFDSLIRSTRFLEIASLGHKDAVAALTKKYQVNARTIKENETVTKSLRVTEALSTNIKDITTANKQEEKRVDQRLVLNARYDETIKLIEDEISLTRRIPLQGEKIVELAKERAGFIAKQLTDNALLESTEAKRQKASIAALIKIKEENVKVLSVIRKIEIDKIIAKAAKNAVVFRDAIQSAFSNIPDNIVTNAERRRDLQEELRVAEFDLQETRREGDKKSIADAQHRIDLVNFELQSYTRGLAEVKALTLSIFDSIGTAFFDNLVEEFANSLNLVKIGGNKIGDIVGKALGKVSNQFAEDWKTEADLHVLKLESVFTAHVNALRDVLGLTRIPSIGGAVTGSPDDTDKKEIPKELKGISKSLRDGFSLIATIAATSITGASGPGARTGSQFGALVGGNAAASLLKNAGTAAGILGGPIGIIAGGIIGGVLGGLFDKGDKPQEPLTRALETNTTATLSNTIALKELDRAIFNAPTRFNVPAFAGSFGAPITIQISGADSPSDVADEVSRILNEQFDNDSRTVGSRGFVPV